MGNFDGEVYTDSVTGAPAALFRLGSSTENLGASVAANPRNDILAFSGSGSQKIYVSSLAKNSDPDPNICSISGAFPSSPSSSATHLIHLETAFSSFLGATAATFATSHNELDTGGAVALFASNSTSGCSSLKIFNNCILDGAQEQGYALAGGLECQATYLGNKTPMLIVSSPGYNSSQGRVDILFQGSQLPELRSCDATATPTPTPTFTPTPTNTPTPTSTYTPPPEDGPAADTPIPIGPDKGGLPPPTVSPTDKAGIVKVSLPLVELQQSVVRGLAKRLRLSFKKMASLVSSKQVQFTYLIKFKEQRDRYTKSTASTEAVPEAIEIVNIQPQSPSRTVRARTVRTRDRISLHRLTPGRIYIASYQVEFSVRGSKLKATTKSSPGTKFGT
jgi:hypothetical protein